MKTYTGADAKEYAHSSPTVIAFAESQGYKPREVYDRELCDDEYDNLNLEEEQLATSYMRKCYPVKGHSWGWYEDKDNFVWGLVETSRIAEDY